MSEKIRLVVCQIECHPALARDRLAYLEEPFMPHSYESSLSHLGSLGITVTDIQELCRNEYIEWHKKRLEALLTHPLLNESIPTAIVFPEGSIPVSCLNLMHSFAKSKNQTIVAGSHTILDSPEAKEIYKAFGKGKALATRHKYNKDVNFVFADGKIHSQKKQSFSPYDRTEITPLEEAHGTIHPIPISVGDIYLRMVSLICADALQLPKIKGDYGLVSIMSYDKDPSHFDSFIGTQVGNGKVIIFCNDGRYGGSSVILPMDERVTAWFFKAPLEGKTPQGDGLLILDIPIGELATQVGVYNPRAQLEVKLLASITYEESAVEDYKISKELYEIANISNNQARNSRLKSLMKYPEVNLSQKYRIEHLHELSRTGADSENAWTTFGNDLILQLPSLTDLESNFARGCYDKLVHQLVESDLDSNSAGRLKEYLKNCSIRISKERIEGFKAPTTPALDESIYIDREDEISRILSVIDQRNEFLLEVTGLNQIGKSATIEKALTRTGFKRIKRVQILNTSSSEYIANVLYAKTRDPLLEISHDKQSTPELRHSMKEWDIVWFEDCEQLLVSGQWKSREIEELMSGILSIAQNEDIKVIFESAVALPFRLRDASVVNKLRVLGFERNLKKHGVAILDRQLRRLDRSPMDIPIDLRSQLVIDLGGHPLAIIYSANAIYEEGLTTVIDIIKQGKGFYKDIIRSILNVVSLSKEDEQLLKVLSGCRIEAPRDAIASVCDFPATDHIAHLSRQCLIEIVTPTTIRLPGILRSRFRFKDLGENIRNLFHKNASMFYSQLAKENPSKIQYAIEAEYHARLVGQVSKVATGLIDGTLAAAKELYDSHNLPMARKILQPIVSESASLDIIRLSALTDAQLGDLPSALGKAEKVLGSNPSDNHLFFVLVKAALTQSRLEHADKLVWLGRKVGISGANISVLEGRIALRRRDFRAAENHFSQSISSPKIDPWAYFYLGKTYIKMGMLQEAIDVLYEGDECMTKRPSKRSIVRNAIRTQLGLAYVLIGDLDPASKMLEILKNEEPDTPEVLYAYWLLIVRRDGVGKASEAFEIFRSAKPKGGQKASHHLFYGLFLKVLNDLPNANEQFALAYKFEPYDVYIMIQYAENLYNLAIREKSGTEMKLAASYANRCAKIVKRIFEFDPDNQFAADLQIDLFYEFGIELTKLKG